MRLEDRCSHLCQLSMHNFKQTLTEHNEGSVSNPQYQKSRFENFIKKPKFAMTHLDVIVRPISPVFVEIFFFEVFGKTRMWLGIRMADSRRNR